MIFGHEKGKLKGVQMINQKCKIMKWLCKANLAGIDHMQIGWVTPTNSHKKRKKVADNHDYLYIESEKVNQLSQDMQFNFSYNLCFLK
jgi:hypothetical protein